MNGSQKRAKYCRKAVPVSKPGLYLPATSQTLSLLLSHTHKPPPFPAPALPFSDSIDLFWQRPLGWMDAHLISRPVLLETGFKRGSIRLLWRGLLQRDCGFWSINNGLYSFTATEHRRVKIRRERLSGVIPQKYCVFTANRLFSGVNLEKIWRVENHRCFEIGNKTKLLSSVLH